MTEIESRITKWGNSIIAVIPKGIAEKMKLKAGQKVRVIILNERKMMESAFGVLKGIRSFTKKDELKTHQTKQK